MKIIKSLSRDGAYNLALEEYLLRERAEDFLLLYVNSPCVVAGRNQSPEAEADLTFCRERGIPVYKRISGGGTVYHDPGNINYAFITSKNDTLLLDTDFCKPVVDALAALGVKAETGPRREILVGGKKVSGTASCAVSGRQIFHGTLLHRTDLDMMRAALAGDVSKRGRRVASVPAEVMNLSEISALDYPTEEFMENLVRFFTARYGCDVEEIEKL